MIGKTDTGVGFKNLLWFIGVVENNFDERLEGRVQVRAFGVHGTVEEVPTADLPWATLVIGNHDVNFTVPPINSWVFGVFLDGRDAQQPMVLGLIPTQMTTEVNPTANGWGVAFGTEENRMSQGSRPQDAGQPTNSRLMRGENLEETYLLAQETNRVKNIDIAGGSAPNLYSIGNMGATSHDDAMGSSATATTVSADPRNPTAQAIPKSEMSDYIKNGLMQRGMSAEEADAWLMNMYDESKLNPGIEEAVANVHGTKGFGLLQWTGDRRTALQNFANKQGKAVNNVDLQLDYLMYERENNEKYAASKIREAASGGTGQMAAAICTHFLRPAETHRISRVAKYTSGAGYLGSSGVTSANYKGGYYPSEPHVTTSWEEPSPAYNAKYPYNRVVETASGHSIEIDDTPGSERVMIWHKSGSYIQLSTSSFSTKSHSDAYSINERNHHVYVGGTNVITVDGDSHFLVKGNRTDEVMGDYKLIVHGNHDSSAGGQLNMIGGEDANIRAARVSMESNVENTNVKVGKVLRFETTETIHLKTKNMYFETAETLNIKVGTDFIGNAVGKISLASDSDLYLAATGNLHAKAEELYAGGGSKVDINASAVNIDDIVNMANGESSSPEESGLEPAAAESATTVQRPAPPAKGLSETVLV